MNSERKWRCWSESTEKNSLQGRDTVSSDLTVPVTLVSTWVRREQIKTKALISPEGVSGWLDQGPPGALSCFDRLHLAGKISIISPVTPGYLA